MADWQNVQPDEYKYLGTNYASAAKNYISVKEVADDAR